MKKIQKKILTANFGRLLKRWIIAVLCVVLLGGGVSAALLAPQLRETAVAVQTVRQQRDQWEHDAPGDGDNLEDSGEQSREGNGEHDQKKDGEHDWEEHRDHYDVEDFLRAGVSRPSIAAFLSMGITALLCGLLALCFWLLVAAWLYQAAALSGMNGPLWGVLGLLGNVFAAALFTIVRSFLRKKCPACTAWQDKTATYCVACGSALREKCLNCGAECPVDARFCPVCGKERKSGDPNGEMEC